MPSALPILFVGDTSQVEFRQLAPQLADCGATIVGDISTALAVMQQGFAPAAILIAQPWPGSVSSSQLEALRRTAPLARLVRILGTWLEGELRTGRPSPGTLRAYWHQAPQRFRKSELLDFSLDVAWSLPSTASDSERLLAASDLEKNQEERTPRHTTPTLVAICASDRQTVASLADLCSARGWQTVWLRDMPQATPLEVAAVLYDVRFGAEYHQQRIANIRDATNGAPLFALIGFPRPEDVDTLKSAGATAVIAKPFLACELIRQLERFVLRAPLSA